MRMTIKVVGHLYSGAITAMIAESWIKRLLVERGYRPEEIHMSRCNDVVSVELADTGEDVIGLKEYIAAGVEPLTKVEFIEVM